jgi:hypothetical protein
MIRASEVASQNPLQFLSVFFLDAFHVLFEGLLFVGFVDVHRVVDQFLEFLVEVVAVVFLLVVFFVNGLDIVVVLLVVRAQLGLLLEELFCAFELLLPLFLFLLDDHCDFSQLSELFEFQVFFIC